MTRVAVIPARYASTRLPGKPLARDTGKYLIQHVYESVARCRSIDRVVVATDDERIAEAVRSFDGEAIMTRADHPSGTGRVAEVAGSLGLADADIVINVQGDEPEINAAVLDRLIEALGAGGEGCSIATIAARFADDGPRVGAGSPLDPNRVKVVVDDRGRALYFSRSLIPYSRETSGKVDRPSRWLLHLGAYAFRAGALRTLVAPAGSSAGSAGALERAESLEQLRWLASGFGIAVALVEHRFVGIDTPQDYAAFVERVGRMSGVECEAG